MHIKINGIERKFDVEYLSLNALLELLNIQTTYIAIAVNMFCITREKYAETFLKEGDSIEILSPMQGG